MNVCFLINQLAPGGAPTLLLDIVRHTDDANIDYTVCFIEGDDTLVSDFEDSGVRVVNFGAEFKFDPRALARMVRFFRREEFDVLHAHLPYSQTLGRVFGQFCGQRTIISTQHDFPRRYHPITRALERVTRHLDSATVAVSQAVERAFTGADAHLYPERNSQWTTIYNGVDIDGFAAQTQDASGQTAREHHDIGPSAPLFLNVGRYVEEKNQARLIEAFAAVRDSHPNAQLVLVGWGPLRDSLEDAAHIHSVADSVTLTGRVNPVEPYYAAADVFVSTSRSESFGIVLVEALAAGLPTVGPDVPGAREVLEHGGVAVPPDDTDALVNAMERALDGEKENVRREELDTFDIDRAANAHVALYSELID